MMMFTVYQIAKLKKTLGNSEDLFNFLMDNQTSYILGPNVRETHQNNGGMSSQPKKIQNLKNIEELRQFTDYTGSNVLVQNVTQENQTGSVGNLDTGQISSISEQTEEVPEVDIAVNNVVCSFSLQCHINLKNLAMEGANVIYKRENNVVNMKIRKPYVTANIWSSGKVTCTGATSEEDSKIAARRVARILQQLCCQRARFCNFRVVNVLGTCSFPWGIKLNGFATAHPKETSYEPEIHPGATYRIVKPKATLKIFSTGSITITAPSVENLQNAVQHIFPLVYPFRLPKNKLDPEEMRRSQNVLQTGSKKFAHFRYKKREEESSDDEESYGSDSS